MRKECTVFEETMAGVDPKIEEMARGLLARLPFRGEDTPLKKGGILSGGERARVALAKFHYVLRTSIFSMSRQTT